MLKSKSSVFAAFACAGLLVSGCQSKPHNGNVPTEYFHGTVLDRHEIGVREKTQYLEVKLNPEDSQLRLTELANVRNFLSAYNASGHGPLVISLPKNAENPQLAVGGVAEVRELAWEAGIDYSNLMGAAYDARGRRGAPIVMAFKSYEASAPDCPKLYEIDMANATSNSDLPSLGCAMRTNLAAMIAEPADLFGDRQTSASDATRRQTQFELWRRGEVSAAERSDAESATIATAVN